MPANPLVYHGDLTPNAPSQQIQVPGYAIDPATGLPMPAFPTTTAGAWFQLHQSKIIAGGIALIGVIAIEMFLRRRAQARRAA